MNRRKLIKKGEKYAFDHLGRKITKGSKHHLKPLKKVNPGLQRIDPKLDLEKTHIRLKFLEAPLERWLTVGRDMRSNIYALLMTAACFFIVFGTVISYENRHLRMEALATLPEE